MKKKLNFSTEMPKLVLPNCILNSILLDGNSYTAKRAGSVTVTGQGILSKSNLFTGKEKEKFKLPMQTLTRIKRQNLQVKRIFGKKTVKSLGYLPESPREKSKTAKCEDTYQETIARGSCLTDFTEEGKKAKGKICKKKNAAGKEGKKEKKIGKNKSKSEKKNVVEGKIDVIKLMQGKKKIKVVKRDDEISMGKKRKKTEFGKDLNQNVEHEDLKIPNSLNPFLQKKKNEFEGQKVLFFEKKKKNSLKKQKRTGNIFFEDKGKTSLEKVRKVKSKDELLRKALKIKPMLQKNQFRKCDKTEEPDQKSSVIPKKKSESDEKIIRKFESSAILIQFHVRNFLARKKIENLKQSFSVEDAEVQNIISLLKQEKTANSSPNPQDSSGISTAKESQISSLQRLKAEEINEIRRIIQHSEANPNILETITKVIDNRYENIEKLMRSKRVSRESAEKVQLALCSSVKTPENFSKFFSKTIWPINDNDASGKFDSESINRLDSKTTTTELIIKSYSENKKFSEYEFCQLSEDLIKNLLHEELEVYQEKAIGEKKFVSTLSVFSKFIEKKFEKMLVVLKKPLRKNPLEVLVKMQQTYTVNPLRWEYSQYPSVIPINALDEFLLSIGENECICLRSEIKMLFDCCNQFLQSFRPYGTSGMPMPWSLPLPALQTHSPKKFFSNLQHYIKQIPSPITSPVPQNEEKLTRIIINDTKNAEKNWIDYELEETQTKLLISEALLDLLVNEIINILPM